MAPDSTQVMDGSRIRLFYWTLVAGSLTMMAVFSVVIWLEHGLLLPGETRQLIAWVLAGVGATGLLAGVVWARPLVPMRPRGQSPEALWRDPSAGGRALVLWVLFEVGTSIGAVGTMMTGSYFTGAVALAGLALLLTHTPGYFESRE